MRSMIVLPSPMRALLAPKSGLYRFLRHLLVQSEEIGERLGIYGRLTRSVNHNICSSETAIHICLYSDRLKEVDVLTTTNGLLKTCRSFFLRVVRLIFSPNFPQKKTTERISVFIYLYLYRRSRECQYCFRLLRPLRL